MAAVALSGTPLAIQNTNIMVGGYMHQPTVSAEAAAAAEVSVSNASQRSTAALELSASLSV
jgi:hypothetical protein